MSRFRLTPTPAQEAVMREHCAHARFVWNLAVEQDSWYRPGRKSAPMYHEQARQLTEARAEFPWLRAGSVIVQQAALRDFDQARAAFFAGRLGCPTWRKAKRREGFRITGKQGSGAGCSWETRRMSRHVGEIRIPKVGWVRFRWSRAVPDGAKSFRVTLDRAGRWHVGFAVIPSPVPGPATGEVVGIDRGIAVSAALSTGELLNCPKMTTGEKARLLRLQRKASRQHIRGTPPSNRLKRTYSAMAKLHAHAAERRKDWCEKTATDVARRFDVIRVEDICIGNLTGTARGTVAQPGTNVRAKAGMNHAILTSGWGRLVHLLNCKAPGRVEKVRSAYTSMTCNACGYCGEGNRKSQAFLCLACGHADHADVNAAKNIAAGHAVKARGGPPLGSPVSREPQRAA